MKSNSSTKFRENYTEWLDSSVVDNKTKEELRAIAGNREEIEERFSRMLSFGTSGLRGLMRAGLNGMNAYTVRYATQGLADVINEEGRAGDGVVIAYDSRNNSRYFAECAAEVLAANGIFVYFFERLRPTPELSFAVRKLQAVAGINITASHNPKEYNGYKVYWDDGAQVAPQKASEIAAAISSLRIFEDVKSMPFEDAVDAGLASVGGAEIDRLYVDAVLAQSLAGDYEMQTTDHVRIVYAAFHGAGFRFVPKVLERIGIKHVIPVKEQMIIDGNYPTVPTPNPEFDTNYELAIKYADSENADIIIGTDPDSDRCGCVVRTPSGYMALNGNQMGILMLDYILARRTELGNLPENGIALQSVVSSSLSSIICKSYGITLGETLTGFKYIGEKLKEYEETGEFEFIFGYEEGIGFLTGTYSRDKDAVLAAMLMAEITCYYKAKGMTVYEGLESLYERFGYCKETCTRLEIEGYGAQERMKKAMESVRASLPETLGLRVLKVRDYLDGYEGMQKTDMLYFELEDYCAAIFRPSGTEPVIKIYVKATGETKEVAESRHEAILSVARDLLETDC